MLRGIGKINIVLLNSIVGQAILPPAITIAIFKFTGDPYWAVTIGLSAGVIIYSIMQIGFCVNIIKMSYMDILIKSYIQPLAIAIPLFIMALLVVLYWHLTELPALIIVSFVTVALYLFLFYKKFATQKERELLIKAKYYCLSSKQ